MHLLGSSVVLVCVRVCPFSPMPSGPARLSSNVRLIVEAEDGDKWQARYVGGLGQSRRMVSHACNATGVTVSWLLVESPPQAVLTSFLRAFFNEAS